MNYRHIYHAGNFADVFKHVLLMMVLERLKVKETPFFMLDTHAGIGMYDITSDAAGKTGEAAAGIGSLYHTTPKNPHLNAYVQLVRQFNPGGNLRHYPGSPAIAAQLVRPIDRLLVNELHPEDHNTLHKNMAQFIHPLKILHMDGYQALRANTPPKERRGVVLIDPPFEQKDEFSTLAKQLGEAVRRWRGGVYMIWFPLKTHFPLREFYSQIKGLEVPKTLLAELWIGSPNRIDALNGCGLAILNTPWQLDSHIQAVKPELEKLFCPAAAPGLKLSWLNGD